MEEEKKEPAIITVENIETEVKVCFEHITRAKYEMIETKEKLKRAQFEIKILEDKLKFVREKEVPLLEYRVVGMQQHVRELEKMIKGILTEHKE